MGLLDDFYSETTDTDLSSRGSISSDSVSTLTPSFTHQSYTSDRLTFIPCAVNDDYSFPEYRSTIASNFDHRSTAASNFDHGSTAASNFDHGSTITSDFGQRSTAASYFEHRSTTASNFDHRSTAASNFEYDSPTAADFEHDSPTAADFEQDSPTASEFEEPPTDSEFGCKLSIAPEIFSKEFNDAREIIDMVVTTISDPPLAWKKETTKITTTLNGIMLKIMHALEQHLQDQDVKIKERMKHIEAEEKLRRQLQIRNEMARAREECASISQKWRQGYTERETSSLLYSINKQ